MSVENRIVSIVDDDPGTTMFFQEALRTMELQFLLLQIQFQH
jgi:hypothetical protein